MEADADAQFYGQTHFGPGVLMMFKKHAPFVNLVRWCVLTIFEQRLLLGVIIVLHFLSGVLAAEKTLAFAVASPPALGDALFVALAGPAVEALDLVTVSTWVLSRLLFWLLVARLINEQAPTADYALLLRVASRRRWLGGVLTSIVIAAVLYVSLSTLCSVAGIGLTLGWNCEPSPFFAELGLWTHLSELSFVQIFTLIWGVTTLSLLADGFLLSLITLRVRRVAWGILLLLSLALLAWLVGVFETAPSWQIWLPPTASIVSRHAPFEPRLSALTLEFTLAYHLVLAGLTALAAFLMVRKHDFSGGTHDFT